MKTSCANTRNSLASPTPPLPTTPQPSCRAVAAVARWLQPHGGTRHASRATLIWPTLETAGSDPLPRERERTKCHEEAPEGRLPGETRLTAEVARQGRPVGRTAHLGVVFRPAPGTQTEETPVVVVVPLLPLLPEGRQVARQAPTRSSRKTTEAKLVNWSARALDAAAEA